MSRFQRPVVGNKTGDPCGSSTEWFTVLSKGHQRIGAQRAEGARMDLDRLFTWRPNPASSSQELFAQW
jgi:hypothetical protein